MRLEREERIIDRILEGDSELFSLIVEEYEQRVYTICVGVLHNQLDAEDATQEVFINIFTSLKKFKRGASLYTWIYRIALNTSLQHLKKRDSSSKVTDNIDNTKIINSLKVLNELPDRIVINKQTEMFITEALQSLPENQRKVFILKKYDNLSQKVITEIMDMSEGAVEQLYQRSKQGLRNYINRKINIKELL